MFPDRYNATVLKSPRQVRNALCYVLNNARKHGLRLEPDEADPFSSSDVFYGWDRRPYVDPGNTSPGLVAKARTWLLRLGWRRHGLLSILETPRAACPPPTVRCATAPCPR